MTLQEVEMAEQNLVTQLGTSELRGYNQVLATLANISHDRDRMLTLRAHSQEVSSLKYQMNTAIVSLWIWPKI